MSKADMRVSRETWVGNLYQKFEAMCHDVDDIVSQEHIKNIENHVQSVGENVMKFCSNVKDLLPSSLGVPVKREAQSVNDVMNNIDMEDGDGECPSVANVKQLPQQMDVKQSCIQVSDELHSKDKLETPSSEEPSSSSSRLQLSQSESFLINRDCDSQSEEEKQSSEISESICPDISLNSQNSDSFTNKEEESLSIVSGLVFHDEYPCEMSTLSMFHNQNHDNVDELSIHVSPSVDEHSTRFEFHLEEETVQDTVDGYSQGSNFLSKEEMVCDSIHKQSPGSEFHLKEEVLCDSINKFSLGSRFHLKEEMACDSIHKCSPGSEFRGKEDIVHNLSESSFDVSNNVHYSLLAPSVTSSESETSNVRLISSVNSPLLEFSDHSETESLCREGHAFNNMVVENGSASNFSTAFISSEASSCILSPKKRIGDMDCGSLPSSNPPTLTEVPDVFHIDNEGLKLKHKEFSVKVELDGSCVFMETDDNHTASCGLERACSRKKKIRDSFSRRKKLEKEYKQLAIWYCDIDSEFDQASGPKLASSTHNKHLSAQDVQESEWELL